MALGRFLDFTEAFSPAFVEPSRVLQGERLTQKRPSDIPQWGLPKRAQVIDFMVAGRELNPRHADFQSAALPTELPGLLRSRVLNRRRARPSMNI